MTVGKYHDMEDDELPTDPQTKKPEWHHKTFAYDLAKWLVENRVVQIKYDWEMTSADSASYWAILVADNKTTRKIGGWHHYMKLVANHRGLVELESYVEDDVRKILRWEEEYKGKIEEFKRLKKELGL